MAVVISGVFCIIVGLALSAGGAKVVSLGGTWYFAIVAAGFLLTGALLLMRRRAALWVYALLMLGALAMHVKVNDPPIKSLPAALMLAMSGTLLSLTL